MKLTAFNKKKHAEHRRAEIKLSVPKPRVHDEDYWREMGYTNQKDLDFLTDKDKKL